MSRGDFNGVRYNEKFLLSAINITEFYCNMFWINYLFIRVLVWWTSNQMEIKLMTLNYTVVWLIKSPINGFSQISITMIASRKSMKTVTKTYFAYL